MISIEDVDLDEAVPVGTREIEVVVSAVGGTISLDAFDVPALAYVSGDADAQDETQVTIRGSLAAVNAALNGLVFDPLEHHNDNLGVSSISIAADDLGNSPAGIALTDQETVTINLVPVNDEPKNLVPAIQTATEDMPLIFSATNNNLISVDDVDVNEGGGLLEVQLLPTNGVVSVDLTNANVNLLVGSGFDDSLMILEGSLVDVNLALEVVTFTPNLNFNAAQGAAGITITTSDRGNTGQGGAQTDSDTILISVTEVNDPPLVSVPPDQAVSEDATLEFSDAFANAITVSDLDIAVTDDVEVTLAADFGVLSIVSAPGLTYEFGADATDEELIKFTGALQDVTAALETVTFRPDADFNDTQGQARLEVSINDLGNHGLGGPLEDVEEVLISVIADNDAPVLTLLSAATAMEDTPYVFSLANQNQITLTDVDVFEGDGNLQVSMTADHGIISLGSSDGLNFTNGLNDTNAMTFVGQLNDIQAALSVVTFTPDLNFNDTQAAGSAGVTISVNDLANHPTIPQTDTESVAIAVLATNDAPQIEVPVQPTTNEDTPLIFSSVTGNQILISDLDLNEASSSEQLLRVVLTTNGSIALGNTSPVNVLSGDPAGDVEIELEGTLGEVNAAIDGLEFTPDQDFNDHVGQATLSITANDLGGSPAPGQETTVIVDIGVNPLNDAPLALVPGHQTTLEDVPIVFSNANASNNGIEIIDVDAVEGTGELEVTLQSVNGVLELSSVFGLNFAVGSDNSSFMTFTGSLQDINASLSGMSFRPALNFFGAAQVSVFVNDLGNTGDGGVLIDSRLIEIDVVAVNDAPVIDAPGDQTVDEDFGIVFNSANGNAIAVSDVDVLAGNGRVHVALAATDGTLSLITTAGLDFVVGDGVSDSQMSFSGALSTVNASLSTITFLPAADFFGVTTLAIEANDLANFPGPALTDQDAVTINVLSVNDAPQAIDDAVTIEQDSVILIDVPANDFDVDGTVDRTTVTLVPGAGPAHGTAVPDPVTGEVTYQPNAGFIGEDVFQYTIRDDLGVASNAAVVTVRVNAVPQVGDDFASLNEGGSVEVDILANDFDVDGVLLPASIQIVSGPTSGSVSLDGAGVATYTPDSNFYGTDSFTYTVADNDGAVSDVATVTLQVDRVFHYQNPVDRFDVNADGFISAIDVLMVLNEVNLVGAGPLPDPPSASEPPPYYDVNGNGNIENLDAVLVVDHINLNSGLGEAEATLMKNEAEISRADAQVIEMRRSLRDRLDSQTQPLQAAPLVDGLERLVGEGLSSRTQVPQAPAVNALPSRDRGAAIDHLLAESLLGELSVGDVVDEIADDVDDALDRRAVLGDEMMDGVFGLGAKVKRKK